MRLCRRRAQHITRRAQMPKAQTVDEALARHVRRGGPDECWPAVAGGWNQRGWHRVWSCCRKRVLAHVAAWEQVNGPVPAGLCVLHSCDNPPCCNPKHLFLGTRADNVADMIAKGRQRPGSPWAGKKLPRPIGRKLSLGAAGQVFDMYLEGRTQRDIAAELGVSDVVVSNILRGLNYTEIGRHNEVAHMLGRKYRAPVLR